MSERFDLSCVEEKYLLRAGDRAGFLDAMGSVPSIRRDAWQVATVYLDREDGSFARSALACPDLHALVRIRDFFTPGGGVLSPSVWIESKERDGRACWVTRFQLHRTLVGQFLRGTLREDDVRASQEPFVEVERALQAARRIRKVAGRGPLAAVGAVSYLRTTFEDRASAARVTLDQEISFHLRPACVAGVRTSLRRRALGPAALEEQDAVLELKYRRARPPEWCLRRLAVAEPLDYSKFRVVSALALSDRAARCPAAHGPSGGRTRCGRSSPS
jgi:hypothetical protein